MIIKVSAMLAEGVLHRERLSAPWENAGVELIVTAESNFQRSKIEATCKVFSGALVLGSRLIGVVRWSVLYWERYTVG